MQNYRAETIAIARKRCSDTRQKLPTKPGLPPKVIHGLITDYMIACDLLHAAIFAANSAAG